MSLGDFGWLMLGMVDGVVLALLVLHIVYKVQDWRARRSKEQP